MKESSNGLSPSCWFRAGLLFQLVAILLFASALLKSEEFFLSMRDRNGSHLLFHSIVAIFAGGFLCQAIGSWRRHRRVSRLVVVVVVGAVLVPVFFFAMHLSLFFIAESNPLLSHSSWHSCRQHCFFIDDVKQLCAKQRGLAKGTSVTWEEVQLFYTNSVYWGRPDLPLAGEPKCPAGGTYTLNPIGTWSLCSIPYHQWGNCLRKNAGAGDGAWR